MNLNEIKLKNHKKVLEELLDRYVRNEIDVVYFERMAKEYKHESLQAKNYLTKRLTAQKNLLEIQLTIDVVLEFITKYEDKAKKKHD